MGTYSWEYTSSDVHIQICQVEAKRITAEERESHQVKQIRLTQRQFAIVDDADYDWLNQYKWHAYKKRGNFYAARKITIEKNKRTTILMSRVILGLALEDKRQGDHQNHITLDNQRDNLRICTNQENNRNRKSVRNSSSRYKGVSWYKRIRKWQAHIQMNRKRKHLGYFKIEKEATLAYNKAARNLFGEFAYLNLV